MDSFKVVYHDGTAISSYPSGVLHMNHTNFFLGTTGPMLTFTFKYAVLFVSQSSNFECWEKVFYVWDIQWCNKTSACACAILFPKYNFITLLCYILTLLISWTVSSIQKSLKCWILKCPSDHLSSFTKNIFKKQYYVVNHWKLFSGNKMNNYPLLCLDS
jgi:hypothetical protein